jgi:periplasmic protein TonB
VVAPPPPPPAPPASPTPLPVGGDIKPPIKTFNVDPLYPEIARAAREEGVVILEVVIATDGSVDAVRVLRGVPMLDQAAVAAVQQWRFEPARLNGQVVPVVMTVTVNFQLTK